MKKFLRGLTLGALIGAGLGIFFNPTSGKQNREKFKKIAKQVTAKLVEEAGKVSKLGKKEYEAIVENVIKKYSKNDLLSPDAWLEIKDELIKRWADVQKELKIKNQKHALSRSGGLKSKSKKKS